MRGPDQPSLLVVFADQMRGRDMRCAGNYEVSTPALDALADEGVRVSHCYANTPVCTPNRGTMLTGLHPTEHGALGNDLPLRTGQPSIGSITHEHGYATGYIGKWHLDGVPRGRFTPPGPRRHGFDFWAAYNCRHDYFSPRYYRDTPELITPRGYEPVVQTDIALQFLEGLTGEQPFCLFLSWGPPHDPYDQVPHHYRDLYDPSSLTLPTNVVPDTGNPLAERWEIRRTIADYYAAITALDDQLDRLLAKLAALGRREDTIIVFTSDHGDMLWAHGWMKKQLPFEESVHIPLIVRWPDGLPAGATAEDLCSSVDLMPTLLSLAGLPLPPGLHGKDRTGVLRGQDAGPGDVVLANYVQLDESRRQDVPEWRGLRTSRWTYAETLGRRPWLLFDNHTDPWQQSNRVEDPACASDREDLCRRLSAQLEMTDDPFLSTESTIDHYGLRRLWREREEQHGATQHRGSP